MISQDKKSIKTTVNDVDFTIDKYRMLCELAVKKYPIVTYRNIPWGKRFLLWRHDLDLSLNRGLSLAKIEHEFQFKATYFLNPHSEFYNLAEASQYQIIKEIVSLGHDIGLHFDASFFGEINEAELNDLVAREADYLSWLFKVRPVAFSFHNPVDTTLTFEADTYGGLLNCYSKRFKKEVPYCSDSNGYWRFRRLHDVLTDATDPCLQVLTHPGWWQDKPMPPRQRVFRSAVGRALGIMKTYDEALQQYGRLNQTGKSDALYVLKDFLPRRFQLCDYLWNRGDFQTLFVELWRIHESQINHLCKAQLYKEWALPAHEVNAFFSGDGLRVDGLNLFNAVFEAPWSSLVGVEMADYYTLRNLRNQIVHGQSSVESIELEQGCVAICEIIGRLGQWGIIQPIGYDGLAHFGSIGKPTLVAADDGRLPEIFNEVKVSITAFPEKRWALLKEKLSELKKTEAVESTSE